MNTTPTIIPAELSKLEPSPDQPRRDVGDVSELARSIREHGVLQPVVARQDGDRLILIFGHRRTAAAKQAGLKTVPCVIIDHGDPLTLSIIENLHRQDLSTSDQVHAIAKLVERVGSQKKAAAVLGKSASWVSDRLALRAVPFQILHAMQTPNYNGELLSPAAVKELRRLEILDEITTQPPEFEPWSLLWALSIIYPQVGLTRSKSPSRRVRDVAAAVDRVFWLLASAHAGADDHAEAASLHRAMRPDFTRIDMDHVLRAAERYVPGPDDIAEAA